MRSLLEFMYAGEVNISQAHLGSFLHTAEALNIRGLAKTQEERKDQVFFACTNFSNYFVFVKLLLRTC